MATYDLGNPLMAKQVQTRLAQLTKSGAIVELTEIRPKRTPKQNNYLHLCLAFVASQLGVDVDYCKQHYFKQHCNPDLFVRTVDDPHLGSVMVLRSTSDLTSSELTAAIARFRDWCSIEGGIYVPEPHETELLTLMEAQTRNNRRWS